MTEIHYLNAIAPEKVEIQVIGDGSIDLSTVTAATAKVTRPNRAELDEDSWSLSITSQSTELIIVEHIFEPGDVSEIGAYRLMIELTFPGGTDRAGPVYFDGVY